MHWVSGVVGTAAAGALALGCFGMASAEPTHPRAHTVSHAHHGETGENSSLAPKQVTGRLPKLVGIVNDNRDIEISDRTPSPGRYKVVVHDSSRRHNWHLYGEGRSRATTVRGEGRWVFKIRLTRGDYRVVCDPHADEMEFDLIVR